MPDHKMRILFNTNATWSPSGYSQQAAHLAPLMRDEGYSIAMSNFFGLEGGIIDLEGIKQYPKMASTWGEDAMIHHSRDFNADLVLTLQDLWVIDPNALRQLKCFIPYCPIDHDPIPPAVFDRLRLAHRVITMSKFGEQELKRLGMHSTFIPHFVDTSVFKPMSKAEAKKKLTIPEDYFVFGMVAANKDNPPRKSFQEVMDAFKMFHDKYPKSAIYFHTNLSQSGGFDIEGYARALGINGVTYRIDLYQNLFKIGKPEMAQIYNAFDCLCMPSRSEGFGIPAIEAQSCGVPVITNTFTSMPEMIIPGVTGELARVAAKQWTPLNSYVAIPDTMSIYQAMEKIYKWDKEKTIEECRKNILSKYDLTMIWNTRWKPFLEKVEKEICS